MRKIYQHPTIRVIGIIDEQPIALSNVIEENDAIINPETMEEGDGSDAVKSNPYSSMILPARFDLQNPS